MYDGLQFVRGKIAFRANPRRRAGGRSALGLLIFAKNFARMPAFFLKGTDNLQIRLFLSRQEIFKRGGDFNFRQPGRAALFHGFDGGLPPLLVFAQRVAFIQSGHDAFSEQGRKLLHAEFD